MRRLHDEESREGIAAIKRGVAVTGYQSAQQRTFHRQATTAERTCDERFWWAQHSEVFSYFQYFRIFNFGDTTKQTLQEPRKILWHYRYMHVMCVSVCVVCGRMPVPVWCVCANNAALHSRMLHAHDALRVLQHTYVRTRLSYYNITLLQKFNNCARHARSQTSDIHYGSPPPP